VVYGTCQEFFAKKYYFWNTFIFGGKMTEYLNNYIDRLQKKRKELRISYDELAEKTGLPRTTITNTMLKYLKRSPSVDVLNKLAMVLDCPTPDEVTQGVSNYKLTPDKEELLMLYEEIGSKLGPEAQKGLITYAKFIAESNK